MCARSVSAIHVVTPGHAGASFLDQRQEREVEEDQPVAGMVDDVGELVVEQPRVDRVDDRAHPRYAVVELEVAITIPGERSDAVARSDAQPGQRVGEPARAGCARRGRCSDGWDPRRCARRFRRRRGSGRHAGSATRSSAANASSEPSMDVLPSSHREGLACCAAGSRSRRL